LAYRCRTVPRSYLDFHGSDSVRVLVMAEQNILKKSQTSLRGIAAADRLHDVIGPEMEILSEKDLKSRLKDARIGYEAYASEETVSRYRVAFKNRSDCREEGIELHEY
jgi:hypothetical protein